MRTGDAERVAGTSFFHIRGERISQIGVRVNLADSQASKGRTERPIG
jgi:hypothetical protein